MCSKLNAKDIIVPGGMLALVGLVVCLLHERRVGAILRSQNEALRQTFSSLMEVDAENQRLSELLAVRASHSNRAGTTNTNASPDDHLDELTRLREQAQDLHRKLDAIGKLREDTKATHDALERARLARRAERLANRNAAIAANGAPFEILEARYGTDLTNLDVSLELIDRIRDGGIKAIASNQLAGDPDYGKVKSLTVVYRFDGRVYTNHYREGDFVILPPGGP